MPLIRKLLRVRRSFFIVSLFASIFLCGLGAKWELIESSGIDLHTKDAWGGHAKQTILPWLIGDLDYWENFWHPWTNHHIGWARLWGIGMVALCGHWDNQFICMFNAFIPCLATCTLLFLFRSLIRGIGLIAIPVILLSSLCFPTGWENTTEGFQITFYLGIASSLGAIAFINQDNYTSIFLGFAFLLLSITSLASTPILVIALLVTICLSLFFQKSIDRPNLLKLVLITVALFVSLALLPRDMGTSQQADNLFEFLFRLFEILSFPFSYDSLVKNLLFALLASAPSFVFVTHVLLSRSCFLEFAVRANFSLLAFSFCFIMALSYTRTKLDIPSRYADISNLFLISNAVSLSYLYLKASEKRRSLIQFSAILWVSLILYGFFMSPYGTRYFDYKKAHWDKEIILNTQNFIDSGGLSYTKDQKLPSASKGLLEGILLDQDFSKILPPSVRTPVPIFRDFDPSRLSPSLPFDQENLYERDFLHLASFTGQESFSSPSIAHDPRYSFLRFYFCGSPGLKSQCLSIVTDNNSRISVNTGAPRRDEWQTVHAFIPKNTQSYRIEVSDLGDSQWLAFKAPVEVSLESWLGRKFRKTGDTIFSIGLISFLFCIAWKCRSVSIS